MVSRNAMGTKTKLETGVPGLSYHPGLLSAAAQAALVADVVGIIEKAPLFRPEMPKTGKPFSVMMTNAGPLGWVSDRQKGYRYEPRHPVTGAAWPEIPTALLHLWGLASGYPAPPECCLVNVYGPGARMGLHQDADEQAMDAPVLSVSLGDTALFRMKGEERTGPSWSVRLKSGDVIVFGGPARRNFHGIDRLYNGSSAFRLKDILPEGGRINLTLRRVTPL